MKIRLFFPSQELPSTIDINRINKNGWEIFIADTDTSFERAQKEFVNNRDEKTFVTCWVSYYSSFLSVGIFSYFRIIF